MTKANGAGCSRCGATRSGRSTLCDQCRGTCADCRAQLRPSKYLKTYCAPCKRVRETRDTCVKCLSERDGSHPSYCRACYRAYDYARAQTPAARLLDQAKQRRYALRDSYGITVEQWDEMFADQNGQCGACGTETPGGRGRFHVDHCHRTGRNRSLLCVRCNVALGQVNDSVSHLQALIAYVERHELSAEQ